MIKGIDVSRWQGLIDWEAVRGSIDFAIIKAGGSDDGLYPDGQFVRNVNEARRLNIPHGLYFYLGGTESVEDEVKHIKNLISMIGGLSPGESLWLDWEEHTANEVSYISGIAKGLISAGLPIPGIYMSLSRVNSQDWSDVIKLGCGLWVASWGNNDTSPEDRELPGSGQWPFWAVWQYSSFGAVKGIGGKVDLNQFNGGIAAFQRYGASTAIAPSTPQPITLPTTTQPDNAFYTVTIGDSLSSIAAKFGHSWQELWALNRDRVSDPNRIFPGQSLRTWGHAANPQQRIYTVASGDNLTSIGAKLGIDWHTLYNNNKAVIGPNPNVIKPGQELRY